MSGIPFDFRSVIEKYWKNNGYKAKKEYIKALPLKWRWQLFGIMAFFILTILGGMANHGIIFLVSYPLFFLAFFIWPLIAFLAMPMKLADFIYKTGSILIWLFSLKMFLNNTDISLSPILTDVLEMVSKFIIILSICFIFYGIFIRKHVPSSFKIKPDHLGKQASNIVAQELHHADHGVWAGQAADNVDLFASVEDRGVVLGPPGSGKTAFLVAQLLKWAETKRSFVCLDSKPEIFGITRQALERSGYRCIVYNPTASHGDRYNLLTDVDSPEAIGELAAALVPSEDDGTNAIFTESARDLLDAIISHLRTVKGDASLASIRSLIGKSEGYKGLLLTLAKSPDPDASDIAHSLAMTAANERLLGSIVGTLRANLRFLRYPKIRASLETSDFSLADLTTNKPVALFLQFEEHQRETTARLLSALTGHLMRYLIRNTARPPVLLALDEIGTIPVVPGLIAKLNTLRSRNLPTWTYWQSLEQMQRYGAKADEGANLILGACDFQMVFRLNDNASAKWMSDRIGVTDVNITNESIDRSLLGRSSESSSMVTEPKVFPHELQQLRSGEVVCTYREQAWRGEATPYFNIWTEYQGKKPSGAALYGEPYPVEMSEKRAS